MATINESLRDESIAHSVWLSRYATGVANRMVKLLNETDADLSARLLDALDRLPPESFTVIRTISIRIAGMSVVSANSVDHRCRAI